MKLTDIVNQVDERKADPVALATRTAKIYGKDKDYGYDDSGTTPGEYIPLKSYDDDLVDELEETVHQLFKRIGQSFAITDRKDIRLKAEAIAAKVETIAIDRLIATQPFVRIEDRETLAQKVSSNKNIAVTKHKNQFFIRDGHHAVLAASLRGERFITANVTDVDFLSKRFTDEKRYTATEWAIISGGHSLDEETIPKDKLFNFGKY